MRVLRQWTLLKMQLKLLQASNQETDLLKKAAACSGFFYAQVVNTGLNLALKHRATQSQMLVWHS